MPPVGHNLYGKLVEQLKLAGQPVPDETGRSVTEQPAPALPRSWDDIAVGHVVLAWDEVLDADVDPETVICAWRSSAKAVEAAERGLDVVMAPMQFLYFDWLNSIDPAEPIAQAPVPYATTWQKVYDFSVRPPGLRDDLRHHILGAQAQLWTEYIATRDHLDYMAFPRVTVFSEVVWGTRTTVDELRPRLETQLGRLQLMGVRFRPLDPVT